MVRAEAYFTGVLASIFGEFCRHVYSFRSHLRSIDTNTPLAAIIYGSDIDAEYCKVMSFIFMPMAISRDLHVLIVNINGTG